VIAAVGARTRRSRSVLRWVVAPRDKGWPCAQPIEDDALAQLRKDAGGYGAGGTMLVTLRDSNAI